jgi:hypothetical protein
MPVPHVCVRRSHDVAAAGRGGGVDADGVGDRRTAQRSAAEPRYAGSFAMSRMASVAEALVV